MFTKLDHSSLHSLKALDGDQDSGVDLVDCRVLAGFAKGSRSAVVELIRTAFIPAFIHVSRVHNPHLRAQQRRLGKWDLGSIPPAPN